METRYQWGLTRADGEGWNRCESRAEAEAKLLAESCHAEDADRIEAEWDAVICLRCVPLSELIGKYAADLVEEVRETIGCAASEGDYEYFSGNDCDPTAELDEDAASEVRDKGVKAMMAHADKLRLWSNVYELVPPDKWPVE